MKRNRIILAAAFAVALAGCTSSQSSDIGKVDLARIMGNWPKFINYTNQLRSDAEAIDRLRAPEAQKNQRRGALGKRYIDMQLELAADIQTAAQQVAAQKHMKLVVTREFVGYGGIDITPDVEKILRITEKESPKP